MCQDDFRCIMSQTMANHPKFLLNMGGINHFPLKVSCIGFAMLLVHSNPGQGCKKVAIKSVSIF